MDRAAFEFPNHPFNLGTIESNVLCSMSALQTENGSILPVHIDPNPLQPAPSDRNLQDRVEFVAKRLRLLPRTFAEQDQTIFIHRVQFQRRLSPLLQDAMSMCALYCLKCDANQTLVLNTLQQKCLSLVATFDILQAAPMEVLAALQSLLMYQVIRLFDGDIRLRAQAEADEPITLLWASHLRTQMCNSSRAISFGPPFSETQVTDASFESPWVSWLDDESIRRTVIVTHMLSGIYNFLKTGFDKPVDVRVYFTAQAALWDAQSDVSWSIAYAEKERLEMKVTQWEEEVTKAKPADLEELAVLIMAMLWGLHSTQMWLGRELFGSYSSEIAWM